MQKALLHSYMHASSPGAVWCVLMLEYLPLHSPLARSPFWQMTREDVKSEQAERGGMSIVASWFVSCYLPSLLQHRRFMHRPLIWERRRLRYKSTGGLEEGGVTDLTLTVSEKLLKCFFFFCKLIFFCYSVDGFVRVRTHAPVCVCVCLCRAARCVRSWWQMVIITVTDMSVSVSLVSTSLILFFSQRISVLLDGLEVTEIRDDHVLSPSSINQSVHFSFTSPPIWHPLSFPLFLLWANICARLISSWCEFAAWSDVLVDTSRGQILSFAFVSGRHYWETLSK